ncbi:PilZ domain-containing protein [Sphingomonas flavescens]|uniref:PilZ domain-containing protein n=1 Tax=Sphingomonas flavescens TaxID=3132797 RepID=UPI002803F60A|nr:PilZ domain-containing protein [Sphingomonas limnosediminicola]
MRGLNRDSGLRPRELRRRVVLPARLRCGSQWSDACILNISSRGMLIQTGHLAPQGTMIEIRRERYVISARIMWRDGTRIGLRCEDSMPVDEILSSGACSALRLVAEHGTLVDRRRSPRPNRFRHHGRSMQFAAVVTISLFLAVTGVLWVHAILAAPLRAVEAALTF